MSTATKLTYDDYVLMPDDGQRYELIDGELCVVPSPNFPHQQLLSELHLLMGPYVRRHGGVLLFSAFDVILSPTNVVQPDMLYVSAEHRSRVERRGLNGAPDLAVEVLSDFSKRRDEVVKRALYERFRVAEYWVIDPEAKTVKVFRLANGKYADAILLREGDVLMSPLFPELQLPVGSIFV